MTGGAHDPGKATIVGRACPGPELNSNAKNRERKQRLPYAVDLRTAHVMRQEEGGLQQNGLEWPNTLHYENTCNNDRIDSVLSFQMLTRKDEW